MCATYDIDRQTRASKRERARVWLIFVAVEGKDRHLLVSATALIEAYAHNEFMAA